MSELLNEVYAICRTANLCVSRRQDSKRGVTEFQLFRQTSPRLTYLGKRSDEKSFLELVRRCAASDDKPAQKQPERAQ